MNTAWILYFIALGAPLLAGIIAIRGRSVQSAGWPTVIGMLVSFGAAVSLVWQTADPVTLTFNWMPGVDLGWHVDPIAASLVALVAFVSLMVHLFSIRYMADDSGHGRYFAKLSFFTFSMIGLLGADHLILLFIFWELVGFSSYLLIGFWFEKEDAAFSARIAFVTNRIADTALLAGIILLIRDGHSKLSLLTIQDMPLPALTLALVGVVFGAFGKSAQLPFFTWLPRAMAGPTPVSALIHAATMVTAGIYLLIRVSPAMTGGLHFLVVVVGVVTAFIAAVAAIAQTDIKKVLAYSTISQLGYMILAVGVGARDMALFHLWTHAFFKAGLFLCAGSVILAMHHVAQDSDGQDMRRMGGLRAVVPHTFIAFTVCAMALAGLPFFSGFISKDGILLASMTWAEKHGTISYIVPVLGFATAALTAFYMARQLMLVFYGRFRGGAEPSQIREPLWTSRVPLYLLALGSLWLVYAINPFAHHVALLDFWFGGMYPVVPTIPAYVVPTISVMVVLAGIVTGWRLFGRENEEFVNYHAVRMVDRLSFNAFFVESFYHRVVVGFYERLSFWTWEIDRRIVDPAIDLVGMTVVLISKFVDLIDKLLVDGTVNLSARLTKFAGDFLRLIHARRVQLHLFWAVAGMLFLLFWLII